MSLTLVRADVRRQAVARRSTPTLGPTTRPRKLNRVPAMRIPDSRGAIATLAFALVACASQTESEGGPPRRSVDLTLQMHLSDVGPAWSLEGDKTMRELAQQTSLAFDSPIRFLSGSIPPRPPIGAEVTVRFAIGEDGHVTRAQIVRVTAANAAVASASLGNSTVRALSDWRFTPPSHNRKTTELCCIRLTID